jgi:hypothetical protein
MTSIIDRLDHLLDEHDADSMEWCDGLASQDASDLLVELSAPDWRELERLCALRGVDWRECLASVLSPAQGAAAEEILFQLASDQSGEVAFHALSQIAFYCGVNANAAGAFLDTSIQVPSFLVASRAKTDLRDALHLLWERSGAHVRSRLDLLSALLADEAGMPGS